jgi:hypothetical protein
MDPDPRIRILTTEPDPRIRILTTKPDPDPTNLSATATPHFR